MISLAMFLDPENIAADTSLIIQLQPLGAEHLTGIYLDGKTVHFQRAYLLILA
jgi:hypothetical protein